MNAYSQVSRSSVNWFPKRLMIAPILKQLKTLPGQSGTAVAKAEVKQGK